MLITLGIPFVLSSFATSAISAIHAYSDQQLGEIAGFLGGILVRLTLLFVPWIVAFLVFLFIYRFVPNTKTYWR